MVKDTTAQGTKVVVSNASPVQVVAAAEGANQARTVSMTAGPELPRRRQVVDSLEEEDNSLRSLTMEAEEAAEAVRIL